jgi:23S rRNA (adenine2503-C2)-methyltransferase
MAQFVILVMIFTLFAGSGAFQPQTGRFLSPQKVLGSYEIAMYKDLEHLQKLPTVKGCDVATRFNESPQSASTIKEDGDLPPSSILSLSLADLSLVLGGSGRAKLFWNLLKAGKDPLGDYGEEGLSKRVRSIIQNRCMEQGGHEQDLLTTEVDEVSVSECQTRKFLQRCKRDGGEIESVLIPSRKFDRTTLCVSTQIGCDRACKFCLTGKMGFIRNLAMDEIVSQVVLGRRLAVESGLPQLTNVVLMGMGDAGRNLEEVRLAVEALTDGARMGMARAKVTISSVGPSPETFMELAAMPGTLAWSLHSSKDDVRKVLVPSTTHTTVQLRDGLIAALKTRESLRMRTLMVACTLIDGVNDSVEDARLLAAFIRPILEVAPKVALDLIPYNDINVAGLIFRPPSTERIQLFTDVLREEGMFCAVRTPRGRAESSACGMLATSTKKEKRKRKEPPTE